MQVEARRVPIYAEYIGRTEASLYVEIRARVAGFLEEERFQEGTRVEAGQVLYVIDKRPYEARRDRARAVLGRAQSAGAKAERDEARLRPLHEQGAASQLDYDDAVTAVEEAKAAVEIAEADLARAELELEYTEVSAPIHGYIGESNVDIGAVVGPGGESLLAVVQRLDPIHLRFSMTALDYLTTRRKRSRQQEFLADREETRGPPGDTRMVGQILITLPDGEEYEFGGSVDFSAPEINPTTGTFSVRAVLPNPDRVLLPGMHTEVRLLQGVRRDAILVPQRALQVEQGGAFVWVVRGDGTVEHRFVLTAQFIGDEVIVDNGLEAGETVVVEGMHKLRPNTPVRIVVADAGEVGESGAD